MIWARHLAGRVDLRAVAIDDPRRRLQDAPGRFQASVGLQRVAADRARDSRFTAGRETRHETDVQTDGQRGVDAGQPQPADEASP